MEHMFEVEESAYQAWLDAEYAEMQKELAMWEERMKENYPAIVDDEWPLI